MTNKEHKIEIEKEPIDIFKSEEKGGTPEKEVMPEQREKAEIGSKKEKKEQPSSKTPPPPKAEEDEKPALLTKSGITRESVENILEENLRDIYSQMDEEHKKVMKEEGEKVASRIVVLLRSAKDKSKDILKLILGWLKLIPGVNKFFLEKEAKIKADRIISLKEK